MKILKWVMIGALVLTVNTAYWEYQISGYWDTVLHVLQPLLWLNLVLIIAYFGPMVWQRLKVGIAADRR